MQHTTNIWVQRNLDYPDPFVHGLISAIPDKWNSPDNWKSYISHLVYDTYPVNDAYIACSWLAVFSTV